MTATRNVFLHVIILATLGLGACGELPQDGPKPFVSAAEQRSHWHSTHVERTAMQDDYSAMPAADCRVAASNVPTAC